MASKFYWTMRLVWELWRCLLWLLEVLWCTPNTSFGTSKAFSWASMWGAWSFFLRVACTWSELETRVRELTLSENLVFDGIFLISRFLVCSTADLAAFPLLCRPCGTCCTSFLPRVSVERPCESASYWVESLRGWPLPLK